MYFDILPQCIECPHRNLSDRIKESAWCFVCLNSVLWLKKTFADQFNKMEAPWPEDRSTHSYVVKSVLATQEVLPLEPSCNILDSGERDTRWSKERQPDPSPARSRSDDSTTNWFSSPKIEAKETRCRDGYHISLGRGTQSRLRGRLSWASGNS